MSSLLKLVVWMELVFWYRRIAKGSQDRFVCTVLVWSTTKPYGTGKNRFRRSAFGQIVVMNSFLFNILQCSSFYSLLVLRYTLGRGGDESNILFDQQDQKHKLYRIERGGEVQLYWLVYPQGNASCARSTSCVSHFEPQLLYQGFTCLFTFGTNVGNCWTHSLNRQLSTLWVNSTLRVKGSMERLEYM